ncbi:MAG: pyridoxine 5'-phosphate synthase [Spirochaetes bacterium GWF1_41_5]|nr:MAG: pyridoxine 5'-phosphate synthase [Spirochaetes bacterium GWF1_41_5]HBE04393.1 pyridoxine 5'-phosphate synthase [Spirochaetia bacterium]
MALLGVNIDHIATLREARRGHEPDPADGALIAEAAGADCITCHLREDRRHIQDHDLFTLRRVIKTRLNLEMAACSEIAEIAVSAAVNQATLVPERREEITTEGGLDVCGNFSKIKEITLFLQKKNISVSLFIDPEEKQISAALDTGATLIEIHTGAYANASGKQTDCELDKLLASARFAREQGLIVNAGHGLNYKNIIPLLGAGLFHEFNIGHSIISRAVFTGLEKAVRDMILLIKKFK